jgi:hypothetical protein
VDHWHRPSHGHHITAGSAARGLNLATTGIELALQEPALRFGAGLRECGFESRFGVAAPSEIQQELASRREEEVIVPEFGIAQQRLDCRECVGRGPSRSRRRD